MKSAEGHGHAGEVDLQELSIALAVGGGVEDGVDVVEDILRAECRGEVKSVIRGKSQYAIEDEEKLKI